MKIGINLAIINKMERNSRKRDGLMTGMRGGNSTRTMKIGINLAIINKMERNSRKRDGRMTGIRGGNSRKRDGRMTGMKKIHRILISHCPTQLGTQSIIMKI